MLLPFKIDSLRLTKRVLAEPTKTVCSLFCFNIIIHRIHLKILFILKKDNFIFYFNLFNIREAVLPLISEKMSPNDQWMCRACTQICAEHQQINGLFLFHSKKSIYKELTTVEVCYVMLILWCNGFN
jgi:hypothetical protein